jgi:hypothetical protein
MYNFLLIVSSATGTNFDAPCSLDPAPSRFHMVPMMWFPNKINSFKIARNVGGIHRMLVRCLTGPVVLEQNDGSVSH